jgi:Tfp pilus assembly protein PilW
MLSWARIRLEAPARRLIFGERGLTLMETLVAMVTGMVVSFALFAILDVSLHQSARLQDKVQADQLGRTAMNRVIDELHSTCISANFHPILAESGENELLFIDAFSKEAIITKAQKHKIVWNKATGALTDYTYNSTSGEWPEIEYSKTASPSSGVRLASNIAQSESGGKKVPIFQYFSYANTSNESALTPLSTLNTTPLSVPFKTEAEAGLAASVLISFNAAPSDDNTALGRSVDFSSQVTFAFSAPPAETPIEDSPCQ